MIKAQDLIDKFWISINENWGYIWGMSHVMWSKARQENYVKAYGDAAKYPDRQMSCKYGSKWYGHYVTDCSGLFAYWIGQLGYKCAHGSNSIYDGYCKRKGTLKNGRTANGAKLKKGTAVFTTNDAGRHGHIGLYVGDGTVIEAEGTKAGVITSKVTLAKWKAWGELNMVDYSESSQAEDPPFDEDKPKEDTVSYPTLRRGAKNEYVRQLQQLLIDRGYNLGRWGADGDFGQATEAAVKAFQRDNGLTADGIAGPKTWAKLTEDDGKVNDQMKDPTYRVIISNLDLAQAKALLNNYPGSKMEEE